MEEDLVTMTLKDEDGRSILCQVENTLKVQGKEYVLLLPIDTPIEIFAWAEDEEDADEEGEMLVDIDEEELEDVFATARAVLAEQDLILNRTALTLTASGEIPEVEEDDIIALDIEDPEGKFNMEQFQQLAAFFFEEQEYVVCTPLDPLLFFAKINAQGEPQLLSPEEFQELVELDEFKALQAQLESEAEDFEDEN
ncbi:MAG: DUF3727 domain-containing protein [Timaviella obliquedivisa GSE-PSE-MK23-08B]|jgi:hypothetical protein|nr:DUF3727 domain-containing protein [Timaviella obliquedivisa GSE-PSE-MK23-08B]